MRRSRRKSDWVYRGYLWEAVDPTTPEAFLSGTYYNPIQLLAGNVAATALVLVDSHDYVEAKLATQNDAAGTPRRYSVGAPAFPDSSQKGLLVKGTDVNIHVYQANTAWFGTSVLHFGARIIVAQQDPETGAMLQHPDYSMWQNVGGMQQSEPGHWANGRQNCWEFRKSWSPVGGTTSTNATPLATWIVSRPRFKRRLEQNEGLFLWLELHPSSNPTTLQLVNPFCRTLVEVPN